MSTHTPPEHQATQPPPPPQDPNYPSFAQPGSEREVIDIGPGVKAVTVKGLDEYLDLIQKSYEFNSEEHGDSYRREVGDRIQRIRHQTAEFIDGKTHEEAEALKDEDPVTFDRKAFAGFITGNNSMSSLTNIPFVGVMVSKEICQQGEAAALLYLNGGRYPAFLPKVEIAPHKGGPDGE